MHMIDVMAKLKEIAESGYDNEDIQRGIDAAATQVFAEEEAEVFEKKRPKQKLMRSAQKFSSNQIDELEEDDDMMNDPDLKKADAINMKTFGYPIEGQVTIDDLKSLKKGDMVAFIKGVGSNDYDVDFVKWNGFDTDGVAGSDVYDAGYGMESGSEGAPVFLSSTSMMKHAEKFAQEDAVKEDDDMMNDPDLKKADAINMKTFGYPIEGQATMEDLKNLKPGDMVAFIKGVGSNDYDVEFVKWDGFDADGVKGSDVYDAGYGLEFGAEGAPVFMSSTSMMKHAEKFAQEDVDDFGEDAVEEVHEDVEEDTSLDDMLKLAGRSGVIGMKAPTAMISESLELDEEEIEEQAVEETVAVPVQALEELMRLAGYENYEAKINEYENDPEPEYMDAEEQMMGLSGGLNGPKKMYPASADGDNPMDQEPREIEESLAESFYTEYSQMIEELKQEDD